MDRLVTILAWMVVIFIVGPLIVIVGGSFTDTPYVAFPPQGFTLDWYARLFHQVDFLHSFLLSLALAVLCTFGALTLGILTVLGLHRVSFFGIEMFRTFLMSPLILPTVVTGVALLQFYYLVHADGSFIGLLLGHILITVPYVVRTVGAGLIGLDPAIAEAAESLGASRTRAALRVVLPAISPSILAAVIFVFITSFDQTTVSIFLAGIDVEPLPVRIYNYIDLAVDPMIAAVSTLLILFAFALIMLLQRLLGVEKAFGIK